MKQMLALYVGLPFAALIGLALPAQCDEVRDFYIKTVHLDGNTTTKGDADHKPEAFPTAPLPDGGGLVLSKPDAEGKWRIRAFTFEPSQIVVKAASRSGCILSGCKECRTTFTLKVTASTRSLLWSAATCTRSTSSRRNPVSSRSSAIRTSRQ